MGRFSFRLYKHRHFKKGCAVFVLPDRFAVLATTCSGFVYAGTVRRFKTKGCDAQRGEIFKLFWGWPMKRKDRGKIAGAKLHASEKELKKFFPQLAEFMTAAVWEGSEEQRESPTITVWCAGGLWKASVKDRSESLVMWLSAETPRELLDMLEGMVNSEDAPWRHDDHDHERNGKRVKKSS